MTSQLVKQIVCLAYSRMPGGHCVAGRELLHSEMPGPWVRPVSNHENEGVPDFRSQYRSGDAPRLLDIMDVPVLNPSPNGHQQENWLIDTKRRWKRVSSLPTSSLSNWVDRVETLWVNDDDSSEGVNDRVTESKANGLRRSLYLIKTNLKLQVSNSYTPRGVRRRVQGRFRYNGTDYWMWVTDPIYEQKYKSKPDGIYRINECFLTISLGGVFNEFAYKLIAAIIKP